MNARAIAAWSASTLGCVLLTSNPVYRGIILLCAVNFVVVVAPRRFRPIGIGVLLAALFAVALNSLLAHVGVHVYAELPAWLPLVGGPLTIESAVYGLDIATGLVAAVLAAASLSLAADPTELIDALPSWLERTGAALAASLNFVPAIGRTFTAVSDAQRMRGWRPRRLVGWGEVLVPVMLTAIEDSVQLAEAMEARGYGATRRTHYPSVAWGWRDAAVFVGAALALAAMTFARTSGLIGDWYPYPSLSLPPVEALAVLACLPLVLPALLWRSRP
jgi:energy-coupling factor transport system permease protein